MSLLPPERNPLGDFAAKHSYRVQQKEDFAEEVVAEQVKGSPELDGVKENYEDQRPSSLKFNLKAAFQKAQAFKGAVDLASDEVTAETGTDNLYFKGIIVSPEALVSRLKEHLQFQISDLEALVGKEERGLDRTKNEPCAGGVQAEYTDELNQMALTQLPTLKYYAEEAGSEVQERNALVDTYEALRKDLIGEDDFEANSSTAAMNAKVRRATTALKASQATLIENLNADCKDIGGYCSGLSDEQTMLLESAFQKIENGDSLNAEDLNELIGLLNASNIQAQKAASLQYYLRFKALSKYMSLQQDKFKKGKKGDTQLLKKVVQFAKSIGFDNDLRVFATELSEETILDVIAYVNKALSNNIFEISAELAGELDPVAEGLSFKLHKGVTKKLSKSQSQFDDAIEKKVKELLNSDVVLYVKELADVEHDCAEVDPLYKIKNTALFKAYAEQRAVVEDVLGSLQGANPPFFQDFKDALGNKNAEALVFETQLTQVNAELDVALGNTSGEHTFASVDQKLAALRDLIEKKHDEITLKRDARRALKAQLKGARDLTEVTSKEDVEALFEAQLNYDFPVKKAELERAVYDAESKLNALNQQVREKAKEVVTAGPDSTAEEKEHVAAKKAAHYVSLGGQDDAQVKLARAQENLASFEETNQKLAATIANAYVCYQDLSNATSALLVQSLNQEVSFDGDLGEFTQALEGLRLETEAVAPAFAKGIQRKLAQVKAETVGAGLVVLGREQTHLQSVSDILGHIEAAHLELQKNKLETNNEHALQAQNTEEQFTILIASIEAALAESKIELIELQERLIQLDECLVTLEDSKTLGAIAERGVLTQHKEDAKASIRVKKAEIKELGDSLARAQTGKPGTLDALAQQVAELTEELDERLENNLFQASVMKTELNLRERDVVQLQSQLSVAKADLREATPDTQERLLKLPPLETLGVVNPSVKLWATGQHRVEGIIAAIPTVKAGDDVALARLQEAVSLLEEREASALVTAKVTTTALDKAKAEFENAIGAEKVELENAVLALEDRAIAVRTTLQVTSEALNKSKRDEEAIRTGVTRKFEEVLAQAEAEGLFSSVEENALVPYELIVPVLLQELGRDFFVEYTNQEIAAFVVKAVKSLSQKLGFDEVQFEKINSDQRVVRSEVIQLEADLEKLAVDQKETIQEIELAKRDAELNKSDLKESDQKIIQLSDLKGYLELNHNCCTTLESRQVELEVTLSALHLAKVELGDGAVEEAEAVSVLEKRLIDLSELESTPSKGLITSSVLEEQEKLAIQIQITRSALDEAKARLVECLEKSDPRKGAVEEAEEAVSLLETKLAGIPLSEDGQAKALEEDDMIRTAIEVARANADGASAEDVVAIIEPLEQVLVDSPLSPEKQEEARVKAQVTSSALEKAKVHLETCREKAEVVRVLQERSEAVKLELSQDRKVLDLVLVRFNKVLGEGLVSSPLFLKRPLSDSNLKECVENAIAEEQEFVVNLRGALVAHREASFNSREKLTQIEESTTRAFREMDAAITRFEDLKEQKEEPSTLKAKAYDFAFQFFGLPLSVKKALKVFCITEDEKDAEFVRILSSILKKRAPSPEVAPVTPPVQKRRIRFEDEKRPEPVPRRVDAGDAEPSSERRDAEWLMDQLGLVSSSPQTVG